VTAPVILSNYDADYQTMACHLYVNYDGSLSNPIDMAQQYLQPHTVQQISPITTRTVPSLASEVLQGPVVYVSPGYVVVGCSGFHGDASVRVSATLDGGNN
jgi:hypothetical protein